MAIRVKYEPAAVGLALASDLAGRGQLAKERQKFREQQRQFEEQLAEQQRQFDTGQEFRGQEFDEGVRRFDLGFDEGSRQFNVNKWMDSQRLLEGQRQYNLSLQERFAKDRKDRQMAIFQQEEADRRAMLAQQGAMARQGIQGQQAMEREQARSADNMQRWHRDRAAAQMNSDWKALQDSFRGWNAEQKADAVEKFEEKWRKSGNPMPFNLPESPPTANEVAVQNHNTKMAEEGKEPGVYIDSNGDVGVYPWYAAELKDQSSENTRQKKNNKILLDLSNDQAGMGETAAGIDADLAEDERTAEAKLVESGGRYDPQSGTWEWGTYGKLDTSDPADADGNSEVTAEEYKAYYEGTGRTPQKPVHPISSSTAFTPRTLGEALDAMGDALQEAGAREKLIQSHAEFESGLAELEAARGKAKREKQKAMRVWQNGVSEAIQNGTVTVVVKPTKDGDPSIEEQLAEKRASGDPITRKIALVGPDGLPIKLFPYDSAPAAPRSAPPAATPAAPPAAPAAGPPARPTAVPATAPAPAEEQEPVDRRTGEPPREAPERRRRPQKERGGESRYIRPHGHITDPETGKPLKGRWFRLKENPTEDEIAAYDRKVYEAKRQAGYSDDERERDLRKNIRPDRSRTEARRERLAREKAEQEERDSLPFRGVSDTYRHLSREPGGRQIYRNIMPTTMGDIMGGDRPSTAEERMYRRMEREGRDPTFGRRQYPKSVQDVLGQKYPDPIEDRQVNVSNEAAPAPGVRRGDYFGEIEGEVRMSVVPQRVRVTPLQSKFDVLDAANKDMHDAHDRWGEVRETFEDLGILQGWTDKDIYEKIVMPYAGRVTGRAKESLHIPNEDKVRMDKLKGKERKEAYRKYEKAIMDYIWFYPEVMQKTPAERNMDPSRPWMGNPDYDPFATDDRANEWFDKKYGRPSGNTFRSR